MSDHAFNEKQLSQEVQYVFPYHYLDFISEEYRYFHHLEYVYCLELVKNALKPFEGQKVLDAGCGDGRFCYEMRKENVEMSGVDYSHNAIQFARAFCPAVTFYVEDLKKPNFPHLFDAITMVEVLEHIDPADIPLILKNLRAALKKDGKLIITVPSINLQPVPKKHYQHFTAQSLREVLEFHFDIEILRGYSCLRGFHRKVFNVLRTVGILIFPLRERLRLIRAYVNFLDRYYKKHLAVGSAEDCMGLMVVARPKS